MTSKLLQNGQNDVFMTTDVKDVVRKRAYQCWSDGTWYGWSLGTVECAPGQVMSKLMRLRIIRDAQYQVF